MGETTGIQWTDATWNPWQGCLKVSPGCKNCYMYQEKERYGQDPAVVVRSAPRTFNSPLRMQRHLEPGESKMVFTCSWSDFFIEEADAWRDEAWAIIEATPRLTYQILTKRIDRAVDLLPWGSGKPWPNVWLVASAENQETLEARAPALLRANVAVRGVSAEPLLGPIDFAVSTFWDDPVAGLHWIILGGESGKGARHCQIEWVRAGANQCLDAGVPVFVKQLGSAAMMRGTEGRHDVHLYGLGLQDPKGADMSEWPSDLRVRQFPVVPR